MAVLTSHAQIEYPGGVGYSPGDGSPAGQGYGSPASPGYGFDGPGYGRPGNGGPGFDDPGNPVGRGFHGPGFAGPGGLPEPAGSGFAGPGGPDFGVPGGPGFQGNGGPGFDGPSGPGGFAGPLVNQASCPNCNFNASVLEAFTQDFTLVSVEGSLVETATTTLRNATGNKLAVNGTIALDIHRMQAQLTLHKAGGDNPHQVVDWDILVNGASRQASLHLSSSRLNACLSAHLPPVHAPADEQLQMIQAMAPLIAQQVGHPGSVDGDDVVVFSQPIPPWETLGTYNGPAVDVDNQTSHLVLLRFPQSGRIEQVFAPLSRPGQTISQLGIKFSNYRASTNFAETTCTIEGQTAFQELLSDPEKRSHLEGQLRQFDQHATALRSIAPVSHVFGSVPTNFVDMFLPESSAMSDFDMLERVHSNRNIHSWVLSSLVLAFTAAIGGVLIHKAIHGKDEVDVYENLEA